MSKTHYQDNTFVNAGVEPNLLHLDLHVHVHANDSHFTIKIQKVVKHTVRMRKQ